MSAQPFPQFFGQQRIILCWAGDKEISVSVDGEIVYIPPVTGVYRQGDPTPHRFQSALDERGEPIPGTVELHDQTWFDDAEMVEKRIFDANLAAKLIFGKDGTGRSGVHKEFCKRGLRWATTPAAARQALEEGRDAYETATVDSAYGILQRRQAVLLEAEKKGQMAPPEDPSVRWAYGVVKAATARGYKRDEISRSDIAVALGDFTRASGDVRVVPIAQAEGPGQPMIEEPPALSAEAQRQIRIADIIDSAKEVGVSLTAAESRKILAGDESALRAAQAKIMAATAE